MKKYELLLPAQNLKAVKAVTGYADAVYFGTETFNMRAHARNIGQKDIKKFVSYCHENDLRAYLTTNIIIYEGELNLLESLIEQAKDAEIDALIVHDWATIKLAKKYNIPFHISTQASISNSSSAQFYEEMGAARVIMARELSRKQISDIVPKMKTAKVEAFVHGAMCTSISGRCYLSQTICKTSEFSANRGKCLQPCRNKWKLMYQDGTEIDYDGYFFLNSKDLCMIEYIPELIEAGIFSFKIEGRMRSSRYVEAAARIYKKAFESYFDGTYTKENKEKVFEMKNELSTIYNRGFSTGFYFNMPIDDDINKTISGNLATKRKTEIGRVITFYRDKSIAKIVLKMGNLKVGDDIYIEGGDLGSFVKTQLNEIFHKNKLVNEIPQNIPKDGFIITIKLDDGKTVKKADRVYIYI